MPTEYKIIFKTEADLKAAEQTLRGMGQIRQEADRGTRALKEHAIASVDVGAKLEKSLLKGVLAGTLAFKGLHAVLGVVGAAFKPVTEGFDQLVASLSALSARGAEFFPIKGLAELFKTAAAWVDVISLKFDNINTKARTYSDLWKDIEKTKRAVALDDEEIRSQETLITTQAEQQLKALEAQERHAEAVADQEEKLARAQAGAEKDPLRKAQRLAQIDEQFAARGERRAAFFRGQRAAITGGAERQLLAIQDIAPTLEQFLPALERFAELDKETTAARARLRTAETQLTDGKFTSQAERQLTEQLAQQARQDIGFLGPQLREARGALPAGVSDRASLEAYISDDQARQEARTKRRAGLLGGFAAQSQAVGAADVTAAVTGPLGRQTRAIEASQSIAAGAAQRDQMLEGVARQLLDQNQQTTQVVVQIFRQLLDQAKQSTAQLRAAANAQP